LDCVPSAARMRGVAGSVASRTTMIVWIERSAGGTPS
jgi:hypothetical protein